LYEFFPRVAPREVEAHITTAIIAEILHRRMMAEAVAKGLISPGQTVKKLEVNPTVIPQLTDHIVGGLSARRYNNRNWRAESLLSIEENIFHMCLIAQTRRRLRGENWGRLERYSLRRLGTHTCGGPFQDGQIRVLMQTEAQTYRALPPNHNSRECQFSPRFAS
jgi:hypothetical protein